jgi:hypothetical protein
MIPNFWYLSKLFYRGCFCGRGPLFKILGDFTPMVVIGA